MATSDPRETLLALCRRLLDDPARGEADLLRIGVSTGSSGLMTALARILPDLPDPDLALVHLERFCRQADPPQGPDALAALMDLLGFSPYLGEAILNDPGYLTDLARARLQEPWDAGDYRQAVARWRRITRSDDPWDALRAFKRRANLRIALRDLQRRASFAEIGREISCAADALIEGALEMVLEEMTAAHGRPQAYDDTGRIVEASLAVIALGKLGGLELNYSSDIDLLFVYSSDGETAGAAGQAHTQTSNKEFFTRAAEKLAQGLGRISAEGQVFRVDCRLRPGGRDGDLVTPVDAAIAYYRSWARAWERQSLLKARPCAGDLDLGARFLSGVEDQIYRNPPDPDTAAGVREMKDRIDAELSRRGVGANLKLGRGGIREIEFTVQSLQLVHGGREPWVRGANTMLALHRLADKGLLSVPEHGALTSAYVFLREAEHRLQLHRNLQRSVLPQTPRERRVLARSLGYRDSFHHQEAAAFETDLEKHQSAVRSIYDAVLGRLSQTTLEDTTGPDPFLDDMPDRSAIAVLEEAGIKGPETLIGSVHAIARLLASPAARASARRAFRRVTPIVLAELSRAHSPVRGLRTLERFLASLSMEPDRMEAMLARRELFGPLVRLFAGSHALSSILVHRPGLVLEEAFSVAIVRERTVDDHVEYLVAQIAGLSDPQDVASLLRVYQRTQILYIGLKDVSRQARPAAIQRSLSALAEAILRVCVAVGSRTTGWPLGEGTIAPGFFVLGLGKLGYAEMDYASDLDIVFLYEAGTSDQAARHAEANRLARQVVEMLTSITREGALYAVDMRLRPFGGEGELAQPMERAVPYFRSSAGVWEMQSFLKARAVAGDLRLGAQAVDEIETAILERATREDVSRAVREMRDRLVPDDAGGEGSIDIKLGRGGLASVQFAAQYLQLRHRVRSPSFKRTTRVLATLRGSGALDGASYRVLFTGFQFLRRLEHQLRLSMGLARSVVPDSAEALEEIAEAMGYQWEGTMPAAGRLLGDLARHRRRIESAYLRVTESVRLEPADS